MVPTRPAPVIMTGIASLTCYGYRILRILFTHAQLSGNGADGLVLLRHQFLHLSGVLIIDREIHFLKTRLQFRMFDCLLDRWHQDLFSFFRQPRWTIKTEPG